MIERIATPSELRRARARPRRPCIELDPTTLRPFLVPPTRAPSPVPGIMDANAARAWRDLDKARRKALAGELAPLERDVGRMIEAAELRFGRK